MTDIALLLARLLMGGAFICWGILKLRGGSAKLVPMLNALHLPDATTLAALIGFCELVGGIGVVLGYPHVTFAVLLGIWCLATAIATHDTDPNVLLSHVTMSGGFFALACAGPGPWALFGGAPSGIWAMLP